MQAALKNELAKVYFEEFAQKDNDVEYYEDDDYYYYEYLDWNSYIPWEVRDELHPKKGKLCSEEICKAYAICDPEPLLCQGL